MTTNQNCPQVSIVLPNFNNYQFLEERLNSIQNQTFTNWQLIVIDSYSNDGAWELIQQHAQNESRMRILQAPKEGVYAAINKGIELAQGEYVYIATSDDTMMPNCLEVMVNALESYPECDICHTPMRVIDGDGNEIMDWWFNTPPAKFYGDLVYQPHIRYAPYDGILYTALRTIYISLTQLLIRRSLFDTVGLFSTDWHSQGDFEWGMRATLVANTIHVPKTVAVWRRHSQQLTQKMANNKEFYQQRDNLVKMVNSVLNNLKKSNPHLYHQLMKNKPFYIYRREQFFFGLQECKNRQERLKYLFNFFPTSPDVIREYLGDRILGKKTRFDKHQEILNLLERLGLNKSIKIVNFN